MKANETVSTPAPVKAHGRSHRKHTYTKAVDGRKQPIRGLWRRSGNYVARLSFPCDKTGQTRIRWVMLEDGEGNPVATLPAAQAALEKLRTQRREDDAPVLGEVPTLRQHIAVYLTHREGLIQSGSKRQTTVDKDRALLERWANAIGHLRLTQIKPAHIVRFRDQLLKEGLSTRTCNLATMALRGLCKHAKLEGFLKNLPMQDMPKLRESQVSRALVDADEITRLCEIAFRPLFVQGRAAQAGEQGQPLKNAQQFADYIFLMAYSGSRRNETLRLKWSDVNFDRQQITIGADGLAKNGEARVVDFNAKLETHLRAMQERRASDSQWLFPSPQRGEDDESAKTFRESLRLARGAARMPRFGFHDCRHFFISYSVMSGIDYMTIAKWVGHKDGGVLIGRVYGHLSNAHARAQAARLNFGPAIVVASTPAAA